MIDLLTQNREALAALCRKYGVVRLEVFGSAATGEYHPAESDVDLLVEFQPGRNLGPWLAAYFELQKEVEQLLGCKVDLVMHSAPKNPYFRREVDRTRTLLYAA